MIDIIIAAIATLGALFVLLAAIGIVRMPDTYLRISVTTKAATLGVGLLLLSSTVFFSNADVTSQAFVIILFLFLTAPVSAHLIGAVKNRNRIMTNACEVTSALLKNTVELSNKRPTPRVAALVVTDIRR